MNSTVIKTRLSPHGRADRHARRLVRLNIAPLLVVQTNGAVAGLIRLNIAPLLVVQTNGAVASLIRLYIAPLLVAQPNSALAGLIRLYIAPLLVVQSNGALVQGIEACHRFTFLDIGQSGPHTGVAARPWGGKR